MTERVLLQSPGDCLTSLRARLIEHTHPDTYLPTLEAALLHWALTHFRMTEEDIKGLSTVMRTFEWPEVSGTKVVARMREEGFHG